MNVDERELKYLRLVRDLSQRMAAEEDQRRLLRLVLDAAIEITRAERGFLVRVRGTKPSGEPRLRIEVVRGFDRTALSGSSSSLSRTVIRRVLERGGRGLVTTDEDQDVLEASSVQRRNVLSIVCVPLRLRGDTTGVLYLDHRFREDAFGEADLPLLSSFADQAAVALETAELRAGAPDEPDLAGEPAPDTIESDVPEQFGRLAGAAPVMRALFAEAERAARSDAPLLILGETGTGKRLLAQEVHRLGHRGGDHSRTVYG